MNQSKLIRLIGIFAFLFIAASCYSPETKIKYAASDIPICIRALNMAPDTAHLLTVFPIIKPPEHPLWHLRDERRREGINCQDIWEQMLKFDYLFPKDSIKR